MTCNGCRQEMPVCVRKKQQLSKKRNERIQCKYIGKISTPIPDAKHSCQELVHFHLRFTHKYQGDLSTISSGPGLQSFLKVKDSSTVMEVILSINKYFPIGLCLAE